MRTWLTAFCLGLVVPVVVAIVLAVPVATPLGGGSPADCAAADTGISVGLVIDFGLLAGEQGAPATVARQCVHPAAGATGYQVLEAGGHSYRVSNSGLLCAIDGYPQGSECGDRTAAGYRYWAYFTGGSGWTYSGIGPAYRHVNEGAVEGWHFVSGAGNPTDPPPNASAQSCPPAPPPTTAPAPSAPPPSTAPAPVPTATAPSGGGARSPGVGSSAGAGSPGPSTGGAAPTATPLGAAGPTTTAPASGGVDGAAPPTSDPGGTPPGTDPTAGATSTDGSTPGGTHPPAAAAPEEPTEVAVTAARASSGGVPLAPVLAALAVVAMGGFAAMRFRARPEDL